MWGGKLFIYSDENNSWGSIEFQEYGHNKSELQQTFFYLNIHREYNVAFSLLLFHWRYNFQGFTLKVSKFLHIFIFIF